MPGTNQTISQERILFMRAPSFDKDRHSRKLGPVNIVGICPLHKQDPPVETFERERRRWKREPEEID